jgi:hypothetical protein
MEHSKPSNALVYLVTVLKCGLAAALLGAVLYVSYTYPQQSLDVLSQGWQYVSTKLAFVGTAAGFIWFILTYPFVKSYELAVDASAAYWIGLFSAYLWFNCMSYSLKKKDITSAVYSFTDNTAGWLGLVFVISVYLVCFDSKDGFETFIKMFFFTIVLMVKIWIEEAREEVKKNTAKKQKSA